LTCLAEEAALYATRFPGSAGKEVLVESFLVESARFSVLRLVDKELFRCSDFVTRSKVVTNQVRNKGMVVG
jgi:hypothetical protein